MTGRPAPEGFAYLADDWRNGWEGEGPRSSWLYGHRGHPLPDADTEGWCHHCEAPQRFEEADWRPYPQPWNYLYPCCPDCGQPWGWGVWLPEALR